MRMKGSGSEPPFCSTWSISAATAAESTEASGVPSIDGTIVAKAAGGPDGASSSKRPDTRAALAHALRQKTI